MFLTSTSSITPTAVASASARPGSSVWTCTFTAPAAADDEERVAELQELRLELLRIDAVALDEEGGAVAELRQLLVDRLERDRLEQRSRLRELLAAHARGHAADDLDQARAAGVDDARLLEDVELLRRPREGDLAGGEHVGQQILDRGAAPAISSARSASARAP